MYISLSFIPLHSRPHNRPPYVPQYQQQNHSTYGNFLSKVQNTHLTAFSMPWLVASFVLWFKMLFWILVGLVHDFCILTPPRRIIQKCAYILLTYKLFSMVWGTGKTWVIDGWNNDGFLLLQLTWSDDSAAEELRLSASEVPALAPKELFDTSSPPASSTFLRRTSAIVCCTAICLAIKYIDGTAILVLLLSIFFGIFCCHFNVLKLQTLSVPIITKRNYFFSIYANSKLCTTFFGYFSYEVGGVVMFCAASKFQKSGWSILKTNTKPGDVL